MSCSRNLVVLRIPCAKYGITNAYQYLMEHQGDVSWDEKTFAPSLAGKNDKYIDYIYHDQPLQFSKYKPLNNCCRSLSPSEKEKFLPKFEKIIPDIDMDDVHLCTSCWYDGVGAPDIY